MRHVDISGRRIEYRVIPAAVSDRPPLVFLHEGLGSAGLWRDFPVSIARAAGARALVYSRFGYGASAPLAAPRTPRFMHEEALVFLPALLDAMAFENPILIGHSDGASIALIYAALSGRPTRGLVLMAPHVFVEDISVESIARLRQKYMTTDLRARLARHHAHVDDAFLGWADAWLDPAFRSWSIETEAEKLTAPTLLIQGREDEYGTLAQIDRIAECAKGPVERLVLDRCGHVPQRDQEDRVRSAIVNFIHRL